MKLDARAQVIATAANQWTVNVDSPIGRKSSPLVFTHQGGELSGVMSDLFGTPIPIAELMFEENRISWRLDITRPLRLSLYFRGEIENGILSGVISSKYPDIPFSSVVPPA